MSTGSDERAQARVGASRDHELLNRIDPDGSLVRDARVRANVLEQTTDDGPYTRITQAVLLVLSERGLLRDPNEPTFPQIRNAVVALKNYWPGGSPANYNLVDRADVLALLEPKKPEPTYKPGDWVVWSRYGKEDMGDKQAMLVTGYPKKRAEIGDRVFVDYEIPGITSGYRDVEHLRPATPDEIARARGEA